MGFSGFTSSTSSYRIAETTHARIRIDILLTKTLDRNLMFLSYRKLLYI